ncbi:MAG: hypothetical protein ACTSUB_02665 [Candidatus Thorarchaeota archaeon]
MQLQKVNIKLPLDVNAFSNGLNACEECERFLDISSFDQLATAYFNLADARLSRTQKIALQCSVKVLTHNKMTLTSLADKISRRTQIPYSTVKWNLRSLVDLGLLVGGDAIRRGQLAGFTPIAKMLVAFLGSIEDDTDMVPTK